MNDANDLFVFEIVDIDGDQSMASWMKRVQLSEDNAQWWEEDVQIFITRSVETFHEDFHRWSLRTSEPAMNELRPCHFPPRIDRRDRRIDKKLVEDRQNDILDEMRLLHSIHRFENNETGILDRAPIQQFNLLAKSWSDRRIDSTDYSTIGSKAFLCNAWSFVSRRRRRRMTSMSTGDILYSTI